MGATFGGPLIVKGAVLAPPDLRGVKTSHHVDLSGLEVSLRRKWPSLRWPPVLSKIADDTEDAARFRRLKEIAEANRDHDAALRFAADENRVNRWNRTPWFASVLDMLFSGISDYGSSIWRPSVTLVLQIPLFAMLYVVLASGLTFDSIKPDAIMVTIATIEGWEQAGTLALSNTVPFLPQTLASRIEMTTVLFGDHPGFWVHATMITQGLFSFVLIFLIGLGLRNRFRL